MTTINRPTSTEADAEAKNSALWEDFDAAVSRCALTLPELRRKLEHAQWALTERECPEQAARMLSSCVEDLGNAD